MGRLNKVCVIGMGYVGLTLAVVMAERGFIVTGIEVNKKVCEQLNRGEPHFHEKRLDVLLRKHLGKKLFVSSEMPKEKQDVFIICVGTPTEIDHIPNLDYIKRATENLVGHIFDDTLIILRSTVPVGTTRDIIKPILDKCGKRYYLSFCPERTAEGVAIKELVEIPQIIGGIDEESTARSCELFRKICPTLIEVSSVEVAEMIKLLNNAYRDLTFAFANEMAFLCEKLKLDPVEAIKAANLGYDRSHIPMPGFVGGACLEKDPHILIYVGKQIGFVPDLVVEGRLINEFLPHYIVEKVEVKLRKVGKIVKESKIFIMGVAFKGYPETDDIRGSLTLDIIKKLQERGCEHIAIQDYVVSNEKLLEIPVVVPETIEKGFWNADCVIFCNNHPNYYGLDIEKLIEKMNKPAVFIDVWHIFDPKEIWREGIVYGGVGI